MSGFISIDTGQAVDTSATMQRTADEAASTSDQASQASNQMGGEVEQCTQIFQQFFQSCQENLASQVGVSSSTLQGTNWTGNSQLSALNIDDTLASDVNNFMGRADSAVQEFRAAMQRQAQDFISAVDTEYRSYMMRYQENQSTAGRGVQQHADSISEVDSNYGVSVG
jgi:Flp pilus assembly protein TadG